MREQGEKEADQKYFINSGRKAVFDDPDDKSIANMRWAYVQKENDLKESEDESKFNETKFDDQFLRFSQILDTDYTGYMVVYSCQENAEWFDDRSGLEIAPEQVW